MFNLIKCKFGRIPKLFIFDNLKFVLPYTYKRNNFTECEDINSNFFKINSRTLPFISKNILSKISKSNFSRKYSKYSDNSEDEKELEEQISSYDLTELSLIEEIKFLQDKKNYIKAIEKIHNLIEHILKTNVLLDERKISQITSHITNLISNYRDIGSFEKSIIDQEDFKRKIASHIKDEEALDYTVLFLNDGIAFDYKLLGNLNKTYDYLKENSDILRTRIQADKLSIIRDTESLQANLINLAESMIEGNEDPEKVNEILIECTELDRNISDKNSVTGFKLYSLLGNINSQLDNLEDALLHYKESLKYKRLQGIEDDEDCSKISKFIAEICVELGDKATALEYYEKCIAIREHLIEYKLSSNFDPEIDTTEEDEKVHCLEIARIYEAIAEVYHGEANLEVTENLVNKALDYYLKHPGDDICKGRCYMILAELYLEKKESEKCIEYSKRFLFAWNKFTKDKKKEISDENFDFSPYSRLDYSEFLTMEYKAYKYIATSYYTIKENFKCKKYSEMAIDKLVSIREGKGNSNKNPNENEVESGELNDFINYKYELAQMYDLCGNYAMTIKEYNEVINKLVGINDEEISLEENSEDKIEKNIILLDAYVGKAEALFKLSRNTDAKRFLIMALQFIDSKNLSIDEEKIEEIRKKIELIDLKLKHGK